MLYKSQAKVSKPAAEQAVRTTQGRLGGVCYNSKRTGSKQQPSLNTRGYKRLGRRDRA
jgi:hypothetical protein